MYLAYNTGLDFIQIRVYNSSMRIRDGETYEEWAKRCQMYEHGYALQRIAEGEDVDTVLESMSKRLMDKLLHPVFKSIQTSHLTKDVEASRKSYEENYIKRVGPRADHILDDLVQTSELHDSEDKSSS